MEQCGVSGMGWVGQGWLGGVSGCDEAGWAGVGLRCGLWGRVMEAECVCLNWLRHQLID